MYLCSASLTPASDANNHSAYSSLNIKCGQMVYIFMWQFGFLGSQVRLYHCSNVNNSSAPWLGVPLAYYSCIMIESSIFTAELILPLQLYFQLFP